MLGPLLFSLFIHNWVAMHDSNSIIKFADDTTVVGLITNGLQGGGQRLGNGVP